MTDTFLKRTTLIVDNAERAVTFFRDTVGMTEYYNQTMTVGGSIIPAGEPGATVHLGIMEGNRPDVAKLGLLEWTDPRLPTPDPAFTNRTRLGIGDVVFVCETPDFAAVQARLAADPACRIHCPPHDWSVPAPDGKGEVQLSTMSFFDADGFFYEVNYKRNQPTLDAFGIRRTTLIVRDVQRSLDFYTEVMGMDVWYDQEMTIGGDVLPAGEPGARVRVAILKGDDPEVGMLGVMAFLDPPIEDPGPRTGPLGVGDVIFVAGAKDVMEVYGRMTASADRFGHTVHAAPAHDEVPGADGSTIVMTTMSFFDPDGFFFELNTRKPKA